MVSLKEFFSLERLAILLSLSLIAYAATVRIAQEPQIDAKPNQEKTTRRTHHPAEMIPLFHPHLGRSQ